MPARPRGGHLAWAGLGLGLRFAPLSSLSPLSPAALLTAGCVPWVSSCGYPPAPSRSCCRAEHPGSDRRGELSRSVSRQGKSCPAALPRKKCQATEWGQLPGNPRDPRERARAHARPCFPWANPSLKGLPAPRPSAGSPRSAGRWRDAGA